MDPKKVAFLADAVGGLAKRFDAFVEAERAEKDAASVKTFSKKEAAEAFLKSRGVPEQYFYMHMKLIDGRWVVQDVARQDAAPDTVFKKGDKGGKPINKVGSM